MIKNFIKKQTAVWILVFTLFTSLIPESSVWAYTTDYANTWTNTGNQANDIAQIALTQVGYTESSSNHTKYNAWYYGSDRGVAWCGIFIAWCANQAGIPTSVIAKCGLASGYTTSNMSSNGYGCPAYSFSSTSAKVGDIIYVDSTGNGITNHVGLVYAVDDTYIYTVEGNSSNKVAKVKYLVSTGHRKLSTSVSSAHIIFYARPNYSSSKTTASKTASAATLAATTGTASTVSSAAVSSSKTTESGSTSTYKTGSYQITASSLNLRKSAEGSSEIVGKIPYQTIIQVSKVSGNWGYTTYNGTGGWICMTYTQAASTSTGSTGGTSSASGSSYTTGIYKVNTSMNVRSAASTDSSILGTINSGTSITVTAVSGRFGKITYKGQTAWVSLKYSQKISSSTESETSEAPVKDTESKTTETAAKTSDTASYTTGTYTVDRNMNVRAKASTESEIIGLLTSGSTVTVSAVNGRFGKITYQGQTAWVSLKYAKLVKASSTTSYTTGTYKINISSLNVRAGADTSYASLGAVLEGDIYKVTEVSGRFGKITYKGKTGWISLKYCVKQ